MQRLAFTRRHLGIVLATLLLQCSEEPTAPRFTHATQEPSPQHPSFDIADGAHGGNAHFYFLPPLVPNPTATGSSDNSEQPVVTVCEWSGTTCARLIALFSPSGGTGAQTVRYDAAGQLYIVNWQTDQCLQPNGSSASCALDAAKVYRLRVLVGSVELGHADLKVFASQQDAKNTQTGALITLINGRTLPVKFRIELGAVAVAAPGAPAPVGAAGGAVAVSVGSEQVGLSVPAGAVAGTTQITVQPAASPPAGGGNWTPAVDLGPTGTTFAQPVALKLSYDPSKLPPGIPGSALRLAAFDGTGWVIVPNSSVDSVANTVSGSISHLSTYNLIIAPNTITGIPTATSLQVGQSTVLTSFVFAYQASVTTNCYYQYSGPFSPPQRICYTQTTSTNYPAFGWAVYWSSNSPGVANVAAGPTYTGTNGQTQSPPIIANNPGTAQVGATVPCTGGCSTLTGSLAITVEATSQITVDPGPGNALVTVAAGSTATTQIHIKSANGVPLQGVVVGPVSDYFTGGIHSWVTSSLSSTSGTDITLTLTLAPPPDQPPQTYSTRFDIAAANAPSYSYLVWPIKVTSGAWRFSDALPSARYGFTAVATPGGIYAIGGNNGSAIGALNGQGGLTDNLFIATSVWNQLTPMPVAAWYTNGGAYLNGRIYVFGGRTNPIGETDTWIYDIASDQWIAGPHSAHPSASCGYTGVIGNMMYVGQAYDGGLQSWFYRFDPATGSWSQLAGSHVPHCFGASGVINGKLYVVGGETEGTSAEVYEPATDSWQDIAPVPVMTQHDVGIVYNGKLYVIGGSSTAASPPSFIWSNVEVYDPASNTWDLHRVPSLNTPRQLFGGVLYVGILEVFGGDLDGNGNSTGTLEYFVP